MLRNGRLIASGLAAAALVVAACASRPESVAGDSPKSPGELQAGAATVLTGATLLLEGDAPRFTIDGDLYAAERTVRIETGPPVEIVLP